MDGSHKSILVVDDEVTMVHLCKLVFREAGYEVRGATSGRQALRMVLEEMPDVVLLDVMMPGMDGIEVCRRIREQTERIPKIVMYTADKIRGFLAAGTGPLAYAASAINL
jgi:CheY-like chemotaxis protein